VELQGLELDKMDKTRWRSNIACNTVKRCKQFEVFLSTDKQEWQIKGTSSIIEDLIPPKQQLRALRGKCITEMKARWFSEIEKKLEKSKTNKRCKPWIVLKDQDSTASVIGHVLDANGEDTYFEHWLTEPSHNTGLLHRCTRCSINIANEANQCVSKKSITQDLHQVKSIEESFVELQPIENIDITFIKSQHFKPKVEKLLIENINFNLYKRTKNPMFFMDGSLIRPNDKSANIDLIGAGPELAAIWCALLTTCSGSIVEINTDSMVAIY
ncbi:14269_t:CDS:2, partial [Dentiscutata heterogama]